jgi:hypothetical protein
MTYVRVKELRDVTCKFYEQNKNFKIWGFHGGDYEEYFLTFHCRFLCIGALVYLIFLCSVVALLLNSSDKGEFYTH